MTRDWPEITSTFVSTWHAARQRAVEWRAGAAHADWHDPRPLAHERGGSSRPAVKPSAAGPQRGKSVYGLDASGRPILVETWGASSELESVDVRIDHPDSEEWALAFDPEGVRVGGPVVRRRITVKHGSQGPTEGTFDRGPGGEDHERYIYDESGRVVRILVEMRADDPRLPPRSEYTVAYDEAGRVARITDLVGGYGQVYRQTSKDSSAPLMIAIEGALVGAVTAKIASI